MGPHVPLLEHIVAQHWLKSHYSKNDLHDVMCSATARTYVSLSSQRAHLSILVVVDVIVVNLPRITWQQSCHFVDKYWKAFPYEEPGSSGSIVSDYRLDDRAIGVRSPAEAKDFSSNLCVQTGSGTHPASCTMGTGGPFPGGKCAAGAWRWPLTPN
jgi:hypothetical protein